MNNMTMIRFRLAAIKCKAFNDVMGFPPHAMGIAQHFRRRVSRVELQALIEPHKDKIKDHWLAQLDRIKTSHIPSAPLPLP